MVEIRPPRRRMIGDMTVHNLSPATQQSYIHAVARFSQYFGRSPDRFGLEDVRAYQVHLISKGISWAPLNQIVCALLFFYGVHSATTRSRSGRLGRGERGVMGAISACRTAALGGHVEQCDDCGARRLAYNSCRNRHRPKC